MREINKNPDSSYENETEFNKGAPKSIFNLFSNRFCNKFQRVIAGAMASIFLLSTPTFAIDNNTGGNTNQNKTNYDNKLSKDLSGGEQFTNLAGVPQSDLTDDGIYAFEDTDTDSYYLMFTNKKTAKADSFYRTVGFTVTPPSLTKQTSGTQDFGSEDSPRIIMDEAYKGTAYNNAGGKHLDTNLSEKGGGNAKDYANVIIYGAPSGSNINDAEGHAVTHSNDTTTTCFKIDLTALRTYASKALGTSYDPTETYYVTLNAIQLIQSDGVDQGGHYFKHTDALKKFQDIPFTPRSQKSLITYYNIPITLGPSAYNAVTLIDVGGTDYEVIGTARDVMLADVNFSMNQTLKNSANFDYSNCNVVGAAVVPYGAFGKEAADKSAEGNCFFIDEALPSHAYYPNYQDMLIKNTANYVTAKYPGNELRKQRGSEDGWFRSYGTTDVSDFVNSQLITGLSKQIDGSWDITNDRHFTGTQVYLFVAPPNGKDPNANLVIYNDATGEPLATGTIDYKIWHDTLKKIYTGKLNEAEDFNNSNDLDKYYQVAGDTTSIFKDSKINNYNLEANAEAKVTNMSVKSRLMQEKSGVQPLATFKEGGTAITPKLTASGLSALNLTFPSSLKTKSGQKLVFKGVEAVFNTTIDEDIAATKSKAGNTINLKSIKDAKNKLVSSNIAKLDPNTSTYQVDNVSFRNNILTSDFGQIFKDNFGKFVSDNKNFIIPTLATFANEVGAGYVFTFANRYTLANIPWDIRAVISSGGGTTYKNPVSYATTNAYSVFSTNEVGIDWQKDIPIKDGYERFSRHFNTNEPLELYRFDFKPRPDLNNVVSATRTDEFVEVDAGNYAEPTSDYIIRAIYEPATVPILYYYKDEAAGRIKLMKSEYTSRIDSTVVKGSVTVDGKKYYTDETSYRENTDLEKDVASTTSDTDIMKDPVDKHRSKSVSVDTKDIASTDKDYVVRVKLVDTPTVLITRAADYEMGTFKIPSQYLAQSFSYNSAPANGGIVDLSRKNGESLGHNSDNFINKQGVFTDSTNTVRTIGDSDTYDNAALESRYVQAVFDHNIFTQIFRAHRGPLPSNIPDEMDPDDYKTNEDGNPFTGAVTRYWESEDSEGNTINHPVPCIATVNMKFKDIAAKWVSDPNIVFENVEDDLKLNASVNEMGGKYSGSADSYKAENGLTQYVLGNSHVGGSEDTVNDTFELNNGVVKTNFGINFTSSRSAFGFKPVIAEYMKHDSSNIYSDAITALASINYTNYDVGNKVETEYETGEAQERIVTDLVVDDDLDMTQTYDKSETHNTSHTPDDPCEWDNESDEINPSEFTRGTFGGYVVASETAKVKETSPVPAPESPSNPNPGETLIDPGEPLKVYPSYNMKITTDSGDKDIPVLSPTPVTINTNLKLKIEGADAQDLFYLKAVFTRGESGSIASGSAYQYLANTGAKLEKKICIDYLWANPEYIPSEVATAYNAKIKKEIDDLVSALGAEENYEILTVSNIPYATGSVDRYKINFSTDKFEATTSEPQGSTIRSKLVNDGAFNDELLKRSTTVKTNNPDFGWYEESFPIDKALVAYQKTITVTYKPGNSNTVVLHINCDSNSNVDNHTSAPKPDSEVDNNKQYEDGHWLIERGNKPYDFATSVLVKPKADNVKFFGIPVDMTMYSTPVKFKVIKSAYDYRD